MNTDTKKMTLYLPANSSSETQKLPPPKGSGTQTHISSQITNVFKVSFIIKVSFMKLYLLIPAACSLWHPSPM